MGEIVDIVYHENESPNSKHLPRYVLIRLPSYKGPPFIPDDPTVIPIVPLTKICPSRCCKQTFIPLKLCFAKTIHTFQGSNAGPVAHGQQQNPIQRLVIDLGTRQFEGNNPGLTYTALSRATTLGDPDDIMTSALYFDGTLTPDRLTNITTRMDNKGLYKKVLLRHQWVKHIEKNRLTLDFPSLETTTLFNWANSFRPSQEQIQKFHSIFTS
jgi:hypothetical protein